MDESALKNLLDTTGFPVAYHHWKKPPELPYVLYLFVDSNNFGADNKVYKKEQQFSIELYSNQKDIASEKILEDILDNNNIFWEKSEAYIESEKMYQVVYDI